MRLVTGSPPLLRWVPFLHRYVHPFVHHLVHNKHVACFHRLATTNKAAMYLGVRISLRELSLIILDTYSNVDHVVTLFLGFWGNSAHNGCITLLSTDSAEGLQLICTLYSAGYISPCFPFFASNTSHSHGCKRYVLAILISFPQGLVVMSIFSCLLPICRSSSVR